MCMRRVAGQEKVRPSEDMCMYRRVGAVETHLWGRLPWKMLRTLRSGDGEGNHDAIEHGDVKLYWRG